MTLRNGHGNGRGVPRIETLPSDEQPIGLPGPASEPPPPEPAGARHPNGQLADRAFASELARRGGLARAEKARQLRSLQALGLRGARPESLRLFLDDADEFAAHEVARLARDCGGGVCPPNAAALVQQAALAMAGSRSAYAAGELALGAKLGAEVRSCLLAARELCVREAQSRIEDDDGQALHDRFRDDARPAREDGTRVLSSSEPTEGADEKQDASAELVEP